MKNMKTFCEHSLKVFTGICMVMILLFTNIPLLSIMASDILPYIYEDPNGTVYEYNLDENGFPYTYDENGDKILLLIPLPQFKITDKNLIAQLDESLSKSLYVSPLSSGTILGVFGEVLTINDYLKSNSASVNSPTFSKTIPSGSGLVFTRTDAFSIHTYHYRIMFSANTKVNVDINMREPDGWYHPPVCTNTTSVKFAKSSLCDYIYFEIYKYDAGFTYEIYTSPFLALSTPLEDQ